MFYILNEYCFASRFYVNNFRPKYPVWREKKPYAYKKNIHCHRWNKSQNAPKKKKKLPAPWPLVWSMALLSIGTRRTVSQQIGHVLHGNIPKFNNTHIPRYNILHNIRRRREFKRIKIEWKTNFDILWVVHVSHDYDGNLRNCTF